MLFFLLFLKFTFKDQNIAENWSNLDENLKMVGPRMILIAQIALIALIVLTALIDGTALFFLIAQMTQTYMGLLCSVQLVCCYYVVATGRLKKSDNTTIIDTNGQVFGMLYIWLLCGCHEVAIWFICGCYIVVMQFLYACYVVAMWFLCCYYVVAMWLLWGCYVFATCLLLNCYLVSIWLLGGCSVVTRWLIGG